MDFLKFLPNQIIIDPYEILESEFLQFAYKKEEGILYLKILKEGETEIIIDNKTMLSFGLELYYHKGSVFIDYKASTSNGKAVYLSSYYSMGDGYIDLGRRSGYIACGNLKEDSEDKIIDTVLDFLNYLTEGGYCDFIFNNPIKSELNDISNEEAEKIIDRSKYFNFSKTGYLN